MTGAVPAPARELRADRFHTGLRIAALAAWLASVILVFVALRLVLSAILGSVTGIGVLVLAVVAVTLGQPLAWLAEKGLLARWPSGRAVQLEPTHLVWRDKARVVDLDLGQKLNFWRWRFEVRGRRGGRVPSGHFCYALRLVQGDTELSLFAFLAPAQADALSRAYPFYELRRTSDAGKQALGGREALFLAAEHKRWEAGAELDPPDLDALLAYLNERLPDFKASAASGG